MSLPSSSVLAEFAFPKEASNLDLYVKSSMFDCLYKFLKLIMWPSDCQFITFSILLEGANCKKIPDGSQVGQLAGLNDHMLSWQLFRN